MDIQLSVVVPLLNEVESLRSLRDEITAALHGQNISYEILFVDDGSTDGSFELIQQMHEEDERITAVRFRRNFGQTAAFSAGFDHAQGGIIITMDADGQNDPADIPALIEKMEEGWDVVNGWRVDRQDPFLFRKFPSKIANGLIARSSGVKLHDRGCSMRAFRAEVVNELRLYGEMHRFIPEMVHFAGFSMTEVAVNHRPRTVGESKYGISRTFRVLFDLLTVIFLRRYGDRPMHIFGWLGGITAGAGGFIGLWLIGSKLWGGLTGGMDGFRAVQIGDRPLFLLAILSVIVGVQFLVIGLLAELMVRTYYESQNKPVYRVKQLIINN